MDCRLRGGYVQRRPQARGGWRIYMAGGAVQYATDSLLRAILLARGFLREEEGARYAWIYGQLPGRNGAPHRNPDAVKAVAVVGRDGRFAVRPTVYRAVCAEWERAR